MTRVDLIHETCVAAITATLADERSLDLVVIGMLDRLDRVEVECLVFALARTAASGVLAAAEHDGEDPMTVWQRIVAVTAERRG